MSNRILPDYAMYWVTIFSAGGEPMAKSLHMALTLESVLAERFYNGD